MIADNNWHGKRLCHNSGGVYILPLGVAVKHEGLLADCCWVVILIDGAAEKVKVMIKG